MKPMHRSFLAILLVALTAAACGPESRGGVQKEEGRIEGKPTPGHPVVGTYMCGPQGETPEDTFEFRDDGTFKNTPPGPKPGDPTKGPGESNGSTETWSIDGNRGAINTELGQKKFTVEGDRLLFDGGFVCTRKSA